MKIKEFFSKYKNKISSNYKKFDFNFRNFLNMYILIIVAVLVTALTLTARYLVILYPTNDVAGIIFSWIRNIQLVGFKNYYTIEADYSYFLLFIYAIISLFPAGKEVAVGGYSFPSIWMYSIKTINYVNDILLAIAIALIIYHLTKDKTKSFISYCIILCLPVQFANSALWGNCDSLYVMLFAFTLLAILKKKDWLVWLLFGFTLGTKLQAVFIAPLLLYLCLTKRLKFYKCYLAIAGLFITFLPTWICGSGFVKPFTYFFTQAGKWKQLTLGCPNLWHLFYIDNTYYDFVNVGATILGLVLIGIFFAILFIKKIKMTDENIIKIATFLISIVPFFLTHMHERYFYFLDVGVVLYALLSKKKINLSLIILMQISSGIAYCHYLSGKYFIETLGEDSVNIATFINILVLGYLFIHLLKLEKEEPKLLDTDSITN